MARKPPTTPRPESGNIAATIAAIATAPGRGGIGIVRVSGATLLGFAEALSGKRPAARRAMLADFIAADDSVIDSGLLLYFPAPRSFTGEDVLELHGHGGPVVMQLLLARCLELGARLADPGEFTRRAYLNGKLDLAQAEAVIDLIDAATAAAARSAVRSLQGEFSREVTALLEQLIELRALVEATLDFPEEEVDFLESADAPGRLDRLQQRLNAVFERARQGRLLQDGLHVVLAGQPNVGKSSLLNALARRDAAIVSAEAGTTRDVIEVRLDLGGLPVIVSDTAGIRETDAAVEQEGIRRSVVRASEADLVIWLTDIDAPEPLLPKELLQLAERTLLVVNKVDLAVVQGQLVLPDDMIAVSVKTGDGLDSLTDRLAAIVKDRIAPGDVPALTQHRHRTLLEDAADSLRAFLAGDANQVELRAEDLRRAAVSVGRITGRIDVEDVLDQVFGRFCIGK